MITRTPTRHVFTRLQTSQKGMALVIVMILVMALAVIVGVFAHAIKVETKLTANTRAESDLEWLGRSGVEVARWVLAEQKRLPGQNQVDALNQFWAGGPGPTNLLDNPFEGWSLDRIELGPGWFSLRIIDQERKMNINALADPRNPANALLMERALNYAGADATDSSSILNALRDWVDRDHNPSTGSSMGGAESEFYLSLDPPYIAKDGPIDDITELLKVRGITPEIFWGASGGSSGNGDAGDGNGRGLVDLFCALSSQQVNVNTASADVLAVVLGVDPSMVQETIIMARAGDNGVEGDEDDRPFPNPQVAAAMIGQSGAVAGVGGGGTPAAAPGAPGPTRLSSQSSVFEVRVDAHIGGSSRRFVAMLDRRNPRDPRILYFRRD